MNCYLWSKIKNCFAVFVSALLFFPSISNADSTTPIEYIGDVWPHDSVSKVSQFVEDGVAYKLIFPNCHDVEYYVLGDQNLLGRDFLKNISAAEGMSCDLDVSAFFSVGVMEKFLSEKFVGKQPSYFKNFLTSFSNNPNVLKINEDSSLCTYIGAGFDVCNVFIQYRYFSKSEKYKNGLGNKITAVLVGKKGGIIYTIKSLDSLRLEMGG